MRKTILFMAFLAVGCLTLTGCAFTVTGLLTEVAFTALSSILTSLVSGTVTPAA